MDNKYISIPSKVYLDRNLPPRTVLLYGFIAALQKDGSCWANNHFFSERLGVSKDCISRSISQLIKHGYVCVSCDPNNGRRRISSLVPLDNNVMDNKENNKPPCSKSQHPLGEKTNHRNIKENNKKNKDAMSNDFQTPSLDDIKAYCVERKSVVDAEEFFLHYAARGWMMGKQPMRNWQAALQSWERKNKPKMAAHEQEPAPVQSAGKHIEYATDADGKKVMTYVE